MQNVENAISHYFDVVRGTPVMHHALAGRCKAKQRQKKLWQVIYRAYFHVSHCHHLHRVASLIRCIVPASVAVVQNQQRHKPNRMERKLPVTASIDTNFTATVAYIILHN